MPEQDTSPRGSVALICGQCGAAFSVYPHRAHTARFCSVACSLQGRRPSKQRTIRIGKPNPAYVEHVQWSRAVKTRDQYACQHCGTTAGRMFAHHIVPWEENSALVFVVENGLTLCHACHSRVHVARGSYKRGRAQQTCEVCGTLFGVSPADQPRHTCSIQCAKQRRAASAAPRLTAPCTRCGQPITRLASAMAKHPVCSVACYSQVAPRPCEVCQTVFEPTAQQVAKGHGRFCSRACSGQAHRGLMNPYYRHR